MNLCTLQEVKAYQNITNTASDVILNFLIATLSAKAATYCGRSFGVATYNEVRNGSGNFRMILRAGPVVSVSSVMIGTMTVPGPVTVAGSGWRQVDLAIPGDGRQIVLNGYSYCRGLGNVAFSYSAGCPNTAVTDELWNVPATPGPYTITLALANLYVGGSTVSYTVSGLPLTLVAGNPNIGQYSITTGGVLTFNAADQGVGVTIGYNMLNIPYDLNGAMLDLVTLRFKAKEWTGFASKSLNGETVSFITDDLPKTVKSVFDSYRLPMIPT